MYLFFSQIFAQQINNPAIGGLGSLNGAGFFGKLIPALLSFGLIIGALVFLFNLISGAISWISAGGDKGKMEVARSKITHALIGMVILFSFFAVLNILTCFFGVGFTRISVGQF